MQILQLNTNDGLSVKIKWFIHLSIHNEKNISDEFKSEKYTYCTNFPFIKLEDNELQQFESNPF